MNKWFNRWARAEKISDVALREAAREVASGRVVADLGGSLFKKRIAKAGAGKSGGYRTIVGYKKTQLRADHFPVRFLEKRKGGYIG